MTWGIRMLRLALPLLVGASAAPVVPALVAPAAAAVQPCIMTFTSAGGTIAPDTPDDSSPPPGKHVLSAFDIKVADARLVTDIDVSWDITHADATQVSLHVIGPKTQPNLAPSIQTYNAGMATGALSGRYSFDDEAGTTKLVGPSPAPRTYLPATPAANLEQYPANGSWSLWVLNQAPYAATLHSWTLTLTYATCDTDGDGVEDRADNCVATANPDQVNRDDDALGDACDLDIDGDALANSGDGCPSLAASTGSGCPAAARTVRLRTPTTDHRLRITVTSPAAGCQERAEATLFRVRKGRGKDLKLVVVTTNARGKARVKAPRRPGRYYVTVARSYAAGEAECASARSARQRLTRRATTTSYQAVDTDGDGLDDTVDGCPAVASGNPTGCP